MQRPSKALINALPNYRGLLLESICIVESENDADTALPILSRESALGFDTESKPTFRKGESSAGPTLIQLATTEQAFLFPTHLPCALAVAREILSDRNIKKIGFGLKPDRKELRPKLAIELTNSQDLAVELRTLLGEKNDIGARAAVAMVLEQRLSKGAQLSNWGRFPLTAQQVEYAANDAHAAICVAQRLMSFGQV